MTLNPMQQTQSQLEQLAAFVAKRLAHNDMDTSCETKARTLLHEWTVAQSPTSLQLACGVLWGLKVPPEVEILNTYPREYRLRETTGSARGTNSVLPPVKCDGVLNREAFNTEHAAEAFLAEVRKHTRNGDNSFIRTTCDRDLPWAVWYQISSNTGMLKSVIDSHAATCLWVQCGEYPCEGQHCEKCGDGPCSGVVQPKPMDDDSARAVDAMLATLAQDVISEVNGLVGEHVNGVLGNRELIEKLADVTRRAASNLTPVQPVVEQQVDYISRTELITVFNAVAGTYAADGNSRSDEVADLLRLIANTLEK